MSGKVTQKTRMFQRPKEAETKKCFENPRQDGKMSAPSNSENLKETKGPVRARLEACLQSQAHDHDRVPPPPSAASVF